MEQHLLMDINGEMTCSCFFPVNRTSFKQHSEHLMAAVYQDDTHLSNYYNGQAF